jgi:hypothetical protein
MVLYILIFTFLDCKLEDKRLVETYIVRFVAFLRTSASVGLYKVVQIWPGPIVCKQVTVCPGHIWTTLYIHINYVHMVFVITK